MKEKWDFSGWATKTNMRCSDGRTILKDAFDVCDGTTVPLVWNHRHNDPSEVLGHALLENRPEGVYAYCSLNNNEKSAEVGELLRHGDITAMSIYANQLVQSAKTPPCDVIHGIIREVSLVYAGANPGAFIDNVLLHGETILDDEAEIYHDDEDGLMLYHADEKEKEEEEVKKSEADEKEEPDDDDLTGVLNSLSDKQKAAVGYLVQQMLKKSGEDDTKATSERTMDSDADETEKETNKNDSEEEKEEMKHNVFDSEVTMARPALSHSDMDEIFRDAKRLGSLKAAVEEHAESGVLAHAQNADGSTQSYGIADIDYLFPDAKTISNQPDFIQRDQDWVDKVMDGTHHTPFSRVKSMHADITEDEARARGYIKGKQKADEVITLLKRTTEPQTIYKKQRLDRDDILDITDFDVVAWLKGEMRLMLREEIARSVLIGDGRASSSDDKIKEDHIRPIAGDDDVYTVKVPVSVSSTATGADKAKALINAAIKARKNYKGSGSPTFFTTEDWLTEILLLEDSIGHKIYKTEAEVATALRVKEVVTVEPMENAKVGITSGNTTVTKDLIGVIVNPKDYNIGTNKGGETSMFDDFDIDYNQNKYLLETRISGALVKPKSALSFYVDSAAASSSTGSGD